MLLTQEHTHIVQFEQAGGVPRLLRQLFGRLYSPQGYLPGWFIEGLATTFDMYLRMVALEHRVLGLDWIGFDGEPWPHGNVRYVYGPFSSPNGTAMRRSAASCASMVDASYLTVSTVRYAEPPVRPSCSPTMRSRRSFASALSR